MSSNPRDVAVLLQEQYGPEGAETELQNRYTDASDIETKLRTLGVLGKLRKMHSDSEPVEAACCGKLGCRTGDNLAEIDGRVLCPGCRAEYALEER